MSRTAVRGAALQALRDLVLRHWPAHFARAFEPDHEELGRLGEEFVARRLRSARWTILARRLRTSAGEVDLLAQDGAELVCVEIKTARTSPLPLPEALAGERERFEHPSGLATRLTHEQFERLARAARLIGREHGLARSERVRIDLVLVCLDMRTRRLTLNHDRGLRAAPLRTRSGKKWRDPFAEGVSPTD